MSSWYSINVVPVPRRKGFYACQIPVRAACDHVLAEKGTEFEMSVGSTPEIPSQPVAIETPASESSNDDFSIGNFEKAVGATGAQVGRLGQQLANLSLSGSTSNSGVVTFNISREEFIDGYS